MDKPRVDSERELEELRLRVQELKTLVERLQMTREALRDSEERYGMLFGKMLAGCALREIICDEDGKPVDYRFLEVNPSFERMFGLEQLEGRLGTELFPRLRDLSFDWLGVYGEVALEGIEANIEQYFEPTGRWYLISAYSPQEGQFATTCWDITDTKRTEERLRRKQKFLATVLDTVGALVMVLDKTGRIVRFNRASETLSGYSFGEVRDLCLWDVLITPKAVDQVRGYFGDNNLSSFPSRCETYLMTKSGEYRLVDWSNSFLFDDNGSIEFVVCSGTDITERRRINNALRESEARLRAFVNSLPDVSLILDEDGRCVEVLASEESLSKQDLYGWKGQLLHNVLSRKDADRFLELIHRTLKTNRAEMMEYSIVANGESHWLEARMSPVLNIAPDKRTVVCITRDITERKLAEEALQQREREFKALVENAPDVIARFDRDCRFL
ncbi:MAG: PAS domain S-box protein [Desulforudis sp.]|nr:MAG: PAS domain S-box protein [Desulforudis sp.]